MGRASWSLRLRVVEVAHGVLREEGVEDYFVTVKPGVWSTYADGRRRRIQFGERMVLHSAGGRAKLAALILHECAHALARQRFPGSRPHGPEFHRVQRELAERHLRSVASSLEAVA